MSVDVAAIRARLEAASPGALIEIVLALRLRAEVAKAECEAALERLAKVEAALDEAAVTRTRAALGGEDA